MNAKSSNSFWAKSKHRFAKNGRLVAELKFASDDIARLKAENNKLGESIARLLAEKAEEEHS